MDLAFGKRGIIFFIWTCVLFQCGRTPFLRQYRGSFNSPSLLRDRGWRQYSLRSPGEQQQTAEAELATVITEQLHESCAPSDTVCLFITGGTLVILRAFAKRYLPMFPRHILSGNLWRPALSFTAHLGCRRFFFTWVKTSLSLLAVTVTVAPWQRSYLAASCRVVLRIARTAPSPVDWPFIAAVRFFGQGNIGREGGCWTHHTPVPNASQKNCHH